MNASAVTPDQQGFSLIETVFALGILSIAVSCSLAVLPLPFQACANVGRGTTAGLIAENLLSEIIALGGLTQIAEPIDLATPPPGRFKFVALNEHGNILRALDQSSFSNGAGAAAAVAAIQVSQDPAQPGLSFLNISVEWPGTAPSRARIRQTYHTLIPCPRS
jgi:prepilin-type N-terminal cleavage/methylation domain-containing protein